MRRILLSIMIIAFSQGCATKYKPKGSQYGFYDYPGSTENQYIVGFIGNQYTDSNTAYEHTYRHARELCREKGLSGFKIIKDKSDRFLRDSTEMKKNSAELIVECK